MSSISTWGGRRKAALAASIVAVAMALGACGQTGRLRDAQAAFDSAATVEDTLRLKSLIDLDKWDASLVEITARANAGYATTINTIDSFSDREIDGLRRDKLWGVALTLKALAYWRLGNYDGALQAARDAGALPQDELMPRDRAIVAAVPALVRNAQGFAIIQRTTCAPQSTDPADPCAKERQALLDESHRLLRDAIDIYGKAGAQVPPFHPVQAYLLQGQLIAYRNLLTAENRLRFKGAQPSDRDTNSARCHLARLRQVLERNSTTPDSDPAIDRYMAVWAKAAVVSPSEAACKLTP